MKTIVFGVSAFITLLIAMYYRKQQTIKKKISLEYMERPQLNVVPENVTSHLIQTLEKLSRTFDSRIEPEMRKYRLLLDSGQRNTTTYEFPTEYQLQLPETIYGMEKISLEKAVFPMSLDLMNTHSNAFTITCTWTGPTAAISNYSNTIPSGNYTITTLATAFQTSLNGIAADEPGIISPAVFSVTIDTTSLIMTITCDTAVNITGLATGVTISAASSSAYFRAITGLPATDGVPGIPGAAVLTGTAPVNVGSPCNLLVFLDNNSFDFNSLRIMKSTEIDYRCFANFSMPSGNGVYGGTPSVGDVNGDLILVQGTSSVSGLGSYTITKDMTNAYYKAYEGAIPSVRFINVKIRQLLPDGTTVTPDFNGANHSMEFEMKARVDKMSATFK